MSAAHVISYQGRSSWKKFIGIMCNVSWYL